MSQPAPKRGKPKSIQGKMFDVHTALEQLKDEHLQCRDFGHSWRDYTARWLPKERVYDVVLECTRCKGKKNRTLSARGERLSTSYTYQDGYQIKGAGRLDQAARDEIRLLSVTKLVGGKVTPIKRRRTA